MKNYAAAHGRPQRLKENKMKHLKILGLAAVAAMALMAFGASSASAAGGMLYKGTNTLGAGSTFDFSIPANNDLVWKDTNGNELDKCTISTVKGELSNAGSSTVNPTGSSELLTYQTCTFSIIVTSTGNKLSFEWTSGTEGKVIADSNIEMTWSNVSSCVYGVESGTYLGTITTASAGAATFQVNAVVQRFNPNLLCPKTALWTGTYIDTEPTNLRIEAS